MKKNAAVARGTIEPIIDVHRDDLINPLCGLKSSYPKMAFKIWLNDNQIDWKNWRIIFSAMFTHNYRSSYWIKSYIRVHWKIVY